MPRKFVQGESVRLQDGRAAKVIDSDPERDCLWVLADGEQHDRKIWTREVAAGVRVPALIFTDNELESLYEVWEFNEEDPGRAEFHRLAREIERRVLTRAAGVDASRGGEHDAG